MTPKMLEITWALDRLRRAFNTGNIFRLAEATGVKEAICCGYTPAPPHPRLAQTALNAAAALYAVPGKYQYGRNRPL